ncbi:class I SAM-dependent methyltransferase [Ensifer adhaerens]|uniref:class I SAM-dependent methyltransferase n=1 Tax=Ensifer adhaerens TaxID=106592 RepID=UPI001CBCDBCB|nr:class I SAM-dependent methyltransferase [Ensifer adhaerens]MBZ7920864.1 class I SAM-dependent methyltransferase [Ensifer adhaerens]UAX93316.1 class I SAM-dependent methyltransferase [Ensifer adhaerens]UAY00953.1 class I SAM-dependent methyltransferase [Ensifer adhaerens]UAY08334.1 class I SAM-dependent methyltransferase [Ensifer adhaerens]
MNNTYGRLASHVYNLDKYIGKSFGDVEYYRARLEGCAGPILEPAVGNGRALIPLLEAGFDVCGFDASEDMLDYCRAQCAERGFAPALSRQTFESFTYQQRFDAIVVPAGSLQLIGHHAVASAVLRRFHDHLAPAGRLIFDLYPNDMVADLQPNIRSWQTETGDLLTLNSQRVKTDIIGQTTVSHLRYDLWQVGRLVSSELEFFTMRWWGVQEMVLTLQAAGFVDIVVTGDYAFGRAPQHGDHVVTFECQRSG